jgi:16S rRNA (guanine527-N7)-methyltransferase
MLSKLQRTLLDEYAKILTEWNRSIRLTGYRTLEDIRTRLIDESVSVGKYFKIQDQDKPVIDFGSGNGAPGIVFSIINPSLPIALVDRKSKKRSFLTYLVGRLGLLNVSIFPDLNDAINRYSDFDAISLWMKGISIESLEKALSQRKKGAIENFHVFKFGILDRKEDCNHIRLHAIKCSEQENQKDIQVVISECDYRPKK